MILQIHNNFISAKNPRTWVNPIKAQVKHNFQASSPHELSMQAGQTIFIAPREIQNTHQLLNTGWVLATLDNQISGIIPINYIQGPQQVRKNTDETVSAPSNPVKLSPIIEESVASNLPLQPEPKTVDIPTEIDNNLFPELM